MFQLQEKNELLEKKYLKDANESFRDEILAKPKKKSKTYQRKL